MDNPTLTCLDPYIEATISFRDNPEWDFLYIEPSSSPEEFKENVEKDLAQLEFPLCVLSWDFPTEVILYFDFYKVPQYYTRADAIEHEITACLPDSDFDIPAIADALICFQQTPRGLVYFADPHINDTRFWELCGSCARIMSSDTPNNLSVSSQKGYFPNESYSLLS